MEDALWKGEVGLGAAPSKSALGPMGDFRRLCNRASESGLHLLLLEQGDLGRLHAKVVVALQQLLGALVGVPGRHDGQRQLRAPARLGLQCQY